MGVATAETQSIKKDAGIEGELQYGQKNISTLQRNLLNADEILRIPNNKLIVNVRGNKPLLLEKMIYTEHKFAKYLKDVPISEYKPAWNKNKAKMKPKQQITVPKQETKKEEQTKEKLPKQEETQKTEQLKPNEEIKKEHKKSQEEINREAFNYF